MDKRELYKTAKELVAPGKGILASDQSPPSAGKLLEIAGVKNTPENRGYFRGLIFTTPDLEKFISGVILHEETLNQKYQGKLIVKILKAKGIIPGIKVDRGKVSMPESPAEMVTEGIDGLRERLIEYKEKGVKFAKWRSVFSVGGDLPTQLCIDVNSELLARYAAYCQEAGLVPIVEPEVLMKGSHSIEEFAKDSKRVLKTVFLYLSKHKIDFDKMLLKPSWIHQGLGRVEEVDSKGVANVTLQVFREVLPDNLPGVVFLSGGDSPEDSTSYLDALNEIGGVPWQLSFSFGRALLKPALTAWQGRKENEKKAQKVFYERARLNSLARSGDY
jgi:fructose-bisphosphate aldolase class I